MKVVRAWRAARSEIFELACLTTATAGFGTMVGLGLVYGKSLASLYGAMGTIAFAAKTACCLEDVRHKRKSTPAPKP